MREEERSVLAANEAFYDAFRSNDADRMAELWSETHPVAVIHPGWPHLHGREAVLESWRRIMEGAGAPDVRVGDARVYLLGAAAFVICREHLPGGDLLATNVFQRDANGAWRMVHHQAGPAPTQPPEPNADVLH